MNRLEQLRQEKHLNVLEMVESIRHIAPTMNAKEWILYEKEGIKRVNDEFWQKVADWFEVDLGYLYGYSKIRNDKYVIDLQDVLHREYELKLEKAKLEKNLEEALAKIDELERGFEELYYEKQTLDDELHKANTIISEFRKELNGTAKNV